MVFGKFLFLLEHCSVKTVIFLHVHVHSLLIIETVEAVALVGRAYFNDLDMHQILLPVIFESRTTSLIQMIRAVNVVLILLIEQKSCVFVQVKV